MSHQREPINPACTEIILGILSSPSLPLRISPLYARSFDGHGFPPVARANKGHEPLSGKAWRNLGPGSQGSRKRTRRVERKRRSLERRFLNIAFVRDTRREFIIIRLILIMRLIIDQTERISRSIISLERTNCDWQTRVEIGKIVCIPFLGADFIIKRSIGR